MGYIRSRIFHRTTNKLNFKGSIFILACTCMIIFGSSASGVWKSYIFIEVLLFENFKNSLLQNKPIIMPIYSYMLNLVILAIFVLLAIVSVS